MDINSINNIQDNTDINDIRTSTDFKGVSFSGYKKPDVRKQIIENIKKSKIEPACYWTAELVCAGHYMDIWETILHYVGKHIHLANPKIVIYLELRFALFRDIMSQGNYSSEIQMRNNTKIRKLFAEIISVLAYSNKTHSFESIKINREEEFDITQMTERLKAPDMTFIQAIFKKDDPKELYIASNEFAYNISGDRKDAMSACYWVEWIIDFDAICKKRKEPCYCEKRNTIQVETKYKRDIIWILWDALLHYSGKTNNPFIDKIMKSILSIFCIKYTTASCKKRRYLLYYAVALLTEHIKPDIEVMTNKTTIQLVVEKINQIYKQIKKNEVCPKTDYLFANVEKQQSIDNSLRKMELVNSFEHRSNIREP